MLFTRSFRHFWLEILPKYFDPTSHAAANKANSGKCGITPPFLLGSESERNTIARCESSEPATRYRAY
jgi:hypothetical protein